MACACNQLLKVQHLGQAVLRPLKSARKAKGQGYNPCAIPCCDSQNQTRGQNAPQTGLIASRSISSVILADFFEEVS